MQESLNSTVGNPIHQQATQLCLLSPIGNDTSHWASQCVVTVKVTHAHTGMPPSTARTAQELETMKEKYGNRLSTSTDHPSQSAPDFCTFPFAHCSIWAHCWTRYTQALHSAQKEVWPCQHLQNDKFLNTKMLWPKCTTFGKYTHPGKTWIVVYCLADLTLRFCHDKSVERQFGITLDNDNMIKLGSSSGYGGICSSILSFHSSWCSIKRSHLPHLWQI